MRAASTAADMTVVHDYGDVFILEAPCTVDSAKEMIDLAKTGGPLAALPPDSSYQPISGYPKLHLRFGSYASTSLLSGDQGDAYLQKMADRLNAAPEMNADADFYEKHTRSKGLVGAMLNKDVFNIVAACTMGEVSWVSLWVYLGPDHGQICIRHITDDAMMTVVADTLYFNQYLDVQFDADYKVEYNQSGVTHGIEFGGVFGVCASSDPVVQVNVDRMTERMKVTGSSNPTDHQGAASDHLGRRLAAPVFVCNKGHIGGIYFSELLNRAPITQLTDEQWGWSDRVQREGSINWDTDGSSPVQDAINQWRRETEQAEVKAFYCPRMEIGLHDIKGPEDAAAPHVEPFLRAARGPG